MGSSLSLSLSLVLTTPSETYFRSDRFSPCRVCNRVVAYMRREKKRGREGRGSSERDERKDRKEREARGEKGKVDPLQGIVSRETRRKPINAKMDAVSTCLLRSACILHSYTHLSSLLYVSSSYSLPHLHCSLYSSSFLVFQSKGFLLFLSPEVSIL